MMMQRQSALGAIHAELWLYILSEWIDDLACVVALDSACCSTRDRPQHLRSLSMLTISKFCLDALDETPTSSKEDIVFWTNSRGIGFRSLSLATEDFRIACGLHLSRTIELLVQGVWDSATNTSNCESLQAFFACCSSLTFLDLAETYGDGGPALRILCDLSLPLRRLSFGNTDKTEHSAFILFINSLSSTLTELRLTEPCAADLVLGASGSSIRSLEAALGEGPQDIWLGCLQRFSRLQTLMLTGPGLPDQSALSGIVVAACPQLQRFLLPEPPTRHISSSTTLRLLGSLVTRMVHIEVAQIHDQCYSILSGLHIGSWESVTPRSGASETDGDGDAATMAEVLKVFWRAAFRQCDVVIGNRIPIDMDVLGLPALAETMGAAIQTLHVFCSNSFVASAQLVLSARYLTGLVALDVHGDDVLPTEGLQAVMQSSRQSLTALHLNCRSATQADLDTTLAGGSDVLLDLKIIGNAVPSAETVLVGLRQLELLVLLGQIPTDQTESLVWAVLQVPRLMRLEVSHWWRGRVEGMLGRIAGANDRMPRRDLSIKYRTGHAAM